MLDTKADYHAMTPAATEAVEDDQSEAATMIMTRPPSLDEILHEIGSNETELDQQENNNDDCHGEQTSLTHMPESSSPPRETTSGAYSFLSESGVLHPVPVETLEAEECNLRTPTLDAAQEAETYDNETDAAIDKTIQDNNDQPATLVTAERLENDTTFAETATVVETVEEYSDDAVIRKILQDDLIASGRSTDELQEFIRTASLEYVASRIRETAEMRDIEEEKTEIVEPDSAFAWALHEQELSMSNPDEHVAVATTTEEEATVIRITEHDVHPAEIESSDARAELIGEDYSVRYAMSPDTIAAPSSTAAAVAAIDTAGESIATEATVLDSKPAAVVARWSGESTEEATVLETTKPPAVESWSRAEEEGEVTVDAVFEEEATVVDITEDVHPAEFEDDAQATFIGRDFTSTVAFGEQVGANAAAEEDALVVGITEDVHPADFVQNETQATLIGTDFTRTISPRGASYSEAPTARPRTPARAVSDTPHHPIASPVDHITSSSFHRGIAALDEMEQRSWMDSPSSFVEGDQVVMPPPASQPLTPMATAEVLDEGVDSETCSVVPPLPPRPSTMGREHPRTSSAVSEESERSSGTTGSGRRAATSLQMVRFFSCVSTTSSLLRPFASHPLLANCSLTSSQLLLFEEQVA